jgi:hydrogenase expression/formation protein HypD
MNGTGIRYADEFREARHVRLIAEAVTGISRTPVNLMEVCGGHTMAIHRNGLKAFLPGNIALLSGPGCPVCVSSQQYVDHAIALAAVPEVIITTYGDLVRVPGSGSSLEKEKAAGKDIRIIYSALEALKIAKMNPGREIVFLGIGFETTAPATAAAVQVAAQEGIANFSVLSAHKVMPPALESLAAGNARIDGFIAPGHVSAITGEEIYRPLVDKFHRAVVISGFEPADIMQSILMLVTQLESKRLSVENQYHRVVRAAGNRRAQAVMNTVFTAAGAEWRGLGIIPGSGLAISERYGSFDAYRKFPVKVPVARNPKGCICGEILTGRKQPSGCPLFASRCTPEEPVGACMVSAEGACSVHYKFNR